MHTKSGRPDTGYNYYDKYKLEQHKQMTRQFQMAGYMRLLIWNVTNMGPVKPGLVVRTITLKLLEFTWKLHENETSVFILHSSCGPHGLLPGVYPSVVRPVILRLEEPAADFGGWPSIPWSPGESAGSVEDTVLHG